MLRDPLSEEGQIEIIVPIKELFRADASSRACKTVEGVCFVLTEVLHVVVFVSFPAVAMYKAYLVKYDINRNPLKINEAILLARG